MSFHELRVKALYLCFYSGWNGRTRTANPPVNSRMLYQLSYEPISHRETHHSKNLSFHLLKINPNPLLYLFDWVYCCKRLNFQGTSYLLKNGKNTRIVAVSALNGLSGGTRTHSLVTPNHAVYQLTYTQIFGVSRTSADFHAWSLPFPLMLYEAPTLNPSALCRLCTDTGKHLGDFIFTFVAPILEGYLGI